MFLKSWKNIFSRMLRNKEFFQSKILQVYTVEKRCLKLTFSIMYEENKLKISLSATSDIRNVFRLH